MLYAGITYQHRAFSFSSPPRRLGGLRSISRWGGAGIGVLSNGVEFFDFLNFENARSKFRKMRQQENREFHFCIKTSLISEQECICQK